MQVKRCQFFFWHDRPIDDKCAKAVIIKLRNANKELVNDKLLVVNENKALTTMVDDLKTENTCLRKMLYGFVSDADLYDEVATLKA